MTISIHPVERTGSRLLVQLWGISGSGKTYTALKIARGMVDGATEIGFLDTENRRGALYSDIFPGEKFLYADMLPPFSPDRYIEAIKAFENAGVKVLIIDSVSHEWEGIGGCQEIAEKNKLGGAPNWALAKKRHKEFMAALMYSDLHVIVCVRASEKVKLEKKGSRVEFVPIGLQPHQEKNFSFEATCSFMMMEGGQKQNVTKPCGGIDLPVGIHEGYIGEEIGQSLIKWIHAEDTDDTAEIESWTNKLRVASQQGTEALKAVNAPAAIKKKIGKGKLNEFLKAAQEFDELEEEGVEI